MKMKSFGDDALFSVDSVVRPNIIMRLLLMFVPMQWCIDRIGPDQQSVKINFKYYKGIYYIMSEENL